MRIATYCGGKLEGADRDSAADQFNVIDALKNSQKSNP